MKNRMMKIFVALALLMVPVHGWAQTAATYVFGQPVNMAPTLGTSGVPYALQIVGGAHTTLTASTEDNDVLLNLARTV